MLAIIILLVGCRSGNVQQAASLPLEFHAPPISSLQNVDLSRLARSTSNNAILYPGDIVEVSIATGIEQEPAPTWKLRIGDDGTVNVPLVGNVPIAGAELTQAEQIIRVESIRRGKYINPNVSVLLNQRRLNRVTVVGAVETPGTYELPANSSDVLAAIVMAGGLSEDASTTIEVRHPPGQVQASGTANLAGYQPFVPTPPRVTQINLESDLATTGSDLQLEDGSTVMVMRRPKQFVHVIGLVKKADQYEIPDGQELRLLDAIALAGGQTLSVADKVHVVRQVEGREEPVVIEASLREAKHNGMVNVRLMAGDVVSVEETPLTFVVGTVKDFVRFGFSSALPLF